MLQEIEHEIQHVPEAHKNIHIHNTFCIFFFATQRRREDQARDLIKLKLMAARMFLIFFFREWWQAAIDLQLVDRVQSSWRRCKCSPFSP